MNYAIKPGDTLLSIASNLTLSGAYAPALAEANGMYADVSDAGETTPFDVQADLSAYGFKTITIPDNWLRTGAAVQNTAGGAAAQSGPRSVPTWAVIGVIAAIALLG